MKMKEDIVEDEDEVMKMCWVDLLVLLERENEKVRERERESVSLGIIGTDKV